jgi:hypothetical protein
MKALISNTQVCQVELQDFPIALPLIWVNCDSTVTTEWTYVDGVFIAPISSIPPEPTYKELRAEAYPTLEEQLDMQYHDKLNLTTTWEDSITAVKETFPKPVVVVEDLVIPIEVPLVEEVLNG